MESFFAYANQKEGSDEDEESIDSIEGSNDDERGEEEERYAEEEYAGYVENKQEFENAEDGVAIKTRMITEEFDKIYNHKHDISKTLLQFQKQSTFLFLNPRLVALSIAFFAEYKEITQPQVTEFVKSHPTSDPADIIRYIRLYFSIRK